MASSKESAKGEEILGVVKEPMSSSLASTTPLSYLEISVGLWYMFLVDVPQNDGISQGFFLGVMLF